MIDNPAISVVFTSYNHKEFLRQALDALINQTFKDFELIVVDDCSTDGSQEILQEYSRRDERIKLVLNAKNSGSYVYSTNQGAVLATAQYLLFAQCDDYADNTQLEKLYHAIESRDVDVVFSSSRMVDKDGKLLGFDFDYREISFRNQYVNDCVIKRKDAQSFLLKSCIIPNLSAALISKSLYDRIGGLSNQFLVLADWDFWLKASLNSDFYFIREPLNNFRQHSTTIRSAIKMKRQINEIFLLFDNYQQYTAHSIYRICRYINNLWIRWASMGFYEWFICFPSIFKKGVCYSRYFIIAFIVEFWSICISKLYK